MTYWIIASDGLAYGPADLETLRRWVAERRVLATTPVGPTRDGPFRDASALVELAAALGLPGGQADAPSPAAPPTSPTATAVPADWPPAVVGVTQLVSGILQLLTATGWFFTCFGVVIAVPLLVLGISELLLYSRRTATAPAEYLDRTRTRAILDICSILVGNIGSAVCGIIILTQLDDARRRIGG